MRHLRLLPVWLACVAVALACRRGGPVEAPDRFDAGLAALGGRDR